jgi:hypothetical protein
MRVQRTGSIALPVKRWRSAAMAMRWTAAAVQEAAKGSQATSCLTCRSGREPKIKYHMAFLLAPSPKVTHYSGTCPATRAGLFFIPYGLVARGDGAGGATVLMFVLGFLPWRCRRLRIGLC